MEFIENEARVSGDEMNLDDETFSENSEIDDDLIDDIPHPDENDLSFYREMNNKFQNQTKNPQQVIFEEDYSLSKTDDQQPELYDLSVEM